MSSCDIGVLASPVESSDASVDASGVVDVGVDSVVTVAASEESEEASNIVVESSFVVGASAEVEVSRDVTEFDAVKDSGKVIAGEGAWLAEYESEMRVVGMMLCVSEDVRYGDEDDIVGVVCGIPMRRQREKIQVSKLRSVTV